MILFVFFFIPVILFFQIADEIIEKEPIGFDNAVLLWLNSHSNAFLDIFFLTFTNIGGVIGMIILTLLIVVFLMYKKQRRKALLVLAGVGGATTANLILKALFQRDRPALFDSLVFETTYSFPSGHAMASSALFLSLILISWQTKWRWLMIGIAIFMVLAISISRLYFGVHYPTDIMAGWCASSAWVVLVFFAAKKLGLRLKNKLVQKSTQIDQ